jgi:hypothetical protein
MKIELKKISFDERLSEETNCFSADLYINGKKVGYCKNNGQGGCTDYYGNTKENNELIRQAEAYCKTLPKIKYHSLELEQSLEMTIDVLIETHLKDKAKKKMEKLFNTAIVFGIPNGNSYQYMNFKRPLSDISLSALQIKVNEIVLTYCKKGIVILNNNLETLGIKL